VSWQTPEIYQSLVLLAIITRSAPCSAKDDAICLPSPDDAPVITAVLPFKLNILSPYLPFMYFIASVAATAPSAVAVTNCLTVLTLLSPAVKIPSTFV